MKIVIDIPEKTYEQLKFLSKQGFGTVIDEAVATGTILPKGHGRLIDADKYLKSVCTYKETGCGSCKLQTMCPADEPTIIETDKESDKDV